MNLKIRSLAFTIAEIIITLGIVGILAEMVIPMLIANVEKQVTVSKVKEIYSIFSQATNQLNNDCGGSISGCITSPTANTDNDNAARIEVTNLYKAKLSLSKDCTDGSAGCFPNVGIKTLYPGGIWNNLQADVRYNNAKFILANGTAVAFRWHGLSLPAQYFAIEVDLNNLANPNQHGKDYFFFIYDFNTRRLTPHTNADCVSPVVPNYGTGCSKRILQENAINYY